RQVGDYQKRRRSPRKQTVRQAPETLCTPYTEWQGDRPGKQHGGNCQKQCVPRAHQQEWRYRTVIGKRESHVAVNYGTEPGCIADRQRLVETVLGTQCRYRLRSNLRIQTHFVEVVS